MLICKMSSDNMDSGKPKYSKSLTALTKLKPVNAYEYGVYAYVLNTDMVNSEGQIEDLYGVMFYLGSFPTAEQAKDHVVKLIEETGHTHIRVARYGSCSKLTSTVMLDNVEFVRLENGKLKKFEDDEFEKQKRQYDDRLKVEKLNEEESKREDDKDTLEYLQRQVFLALNHKAKIEYMRAQLEEVTKKYSECETKIRNHHNEHPDHEGQILDYFKNKLERNKEGYLFDSIKSAYDNVREDLFQLNQDSDDGKEGDVGVCTGGVCFV